MFKTTFVEKSQKRNYFKNQRSGFYNLTCNETHVLAKRSHFVLVILTPVITLNMSWVNRILQYLAWWLPTSVSNFVKITFREKCLQTQLTKTESHFLLPSFEMSVKAQFNSTIIPDGEKLKESYDRIQLQKQLFPKY